MAGGYSLRNSRIVPRCAMLGCLLLTIDLGLPDPISEFAGVRGDKSTTKINRLGVPTTGADCGRPVHCLGVASYASPYFRAHQPRARRFKRPLKAPPHRADAMCGAAQRI